MKKSWKNHENNDEKIIKNEVKKRTAKIPKLWPWLQREAIFWNPPGHRSTKTRSDWFPPEPPSYKRLRTVAQRPSPEGALPVIRQGPIRRNQA